jgi:replicative DNA helicase
VITLPTNVEAERLVLGSVLLDEAAYDACEALAVDDFSLDANRRIFTAMKTLRERGEPIDRVTLASALQDQDELEAVGGLSYLVSLDDGLPRIVNLESYVRIVRDKAVLRRTAFACQNILARVTSAGAEPPADLLDEAERLLGGLRDRLADDSEFRTPLEIITEAGGLDGYLQRRRIPGVLSPWPRLNIFTHGLRPGELCILAAATGGGKTAFALNWTVHAAREGHGVALFSMEMGSEELNDRLLSIAGAFDSRTLWRHPGDADRAVIMRSASEISELPIYIRDKTTCTVEGIIGAARKLKARTRLGLVVVDYLQLLTSGGRQENRTQEVSSFSRGLKRAAMELGVPFLALSQLNRRPEQEKRPPELGDLRESGSIGQDANIVLFLYGQHDYQSTPNQFLPIDLMMAKQRRGPTRLTIPLLFRADCGRFESRLEDGQ